jgi:hypothetical protein
MPAAKQALLIDIDDCKIYPLSTDSSGSAPTYGAAIDIPNIVELTYNDETQSALAKGDAAVKGASLKTTHGKGKAKMTGLPLDVLQAMLGGTVTTAGTTPNQTATWSVSGGAFASYFKLAGRAAVAEGIDATASGAQIIIYKAKLASAPSITFGGSDYATLEFDFVAVQPNGTAGIRDIIIQETKAALP